MTDNRREDMVGLFPGFTTTPTPTLPPPPSLLDKKEGQVVPIDVVAGEAGFRSGCDMGRGEDNEMEFDPEFKPVEHPMEPIDEDRPVKCPKPPSSFLNDDGTWKVPIAVSLFKGADPPVGNQEIIFEHAIQADHKRHHTVTREPNAPPSSARDVHYNIFQVFQQCKGF